MALKPTDVTALYLTMFNRAPEGNGQKGWVKLANEKGYDMAQAAQIMLDSPASKEYFAGKNGSMDFVEHIYKNLLGKDRMQDEAGIKAWANEIDMGKAKGAVVSELLKTALNTNFNKHYSGQELADAQKAQNLLLNKIKVSEIAVKFADDVAAGTTINEQIKPFVELATKVTADMTVPMAIYLAAKTMYAGGAAAKEKIFPSDAKAGMELIKALHAQLISGNEKESDGAYTLLPDDEGDAGDIAYALKFASENKTIEYWLGKMKGADADWDQTLLSDVGFAGINLDNPNLL